MRDQDSTIYTGAIETAEEFGRRLYTEAWQRGWSRAKKKVVLGDGAVWIWNIADREFPGALQIVDLYHARQRLWVLATKIFSTDERQRKRWANKLQEKLDQGKIESLAHQPTIFPGLNSRAGKLLRVEADYFDRNASRMCYPDCQRQHLFAGSGVNAIIALRCNLLSRKFEDYWASPSRAA